MNWSKGFYAGTSADLKFLTALPGRNKSVYGDKVTTDDILSGKVQAPPAAKELYKALDNLLVGASQ